MLPSPGFSIPSLGTPLHQPEPDQEILPSAYQQHQPQPPMGVMGQMSQAGQMYGMAAMSLSPFTTPGKSMPHSYVSSYAPPPQSMIQPQTPVIKY